MAACCQRTFKRTVPTLLGPACIACISILSPSIPSHFTFSLYIKSHWLINALEFSLTKTLTNGFFPSFLFSYNLFNFFWTVHKASLYIITPIPQQGKKTNLTVFICMAPTILLQSSQKAKLLFLYTIVHITHN